MAQKINPKQIQSPAAWATLPYAAGWGDYDATTNQWMGGRYTKLASGLVIMKGLVRNTSGASKGSGSVIGTLPVGYRPVNTLRIASSNAGGPGDPVDINSNGTITTNIAIANSEWVSLSSVIFLAEQ